MNNKLIGFIGQGWIGKNYADDFEQRGFSVVRYSLEEPYIHNAEKIKDCDIVFIAVPTPTTPKGFDDSYVREVVKHIGKGKIAVIKSTLLPGTTESIQNANPDIFIMHSPEFLVEATAAYDAANPTRNIIGLPIDNEEYQIKAEAVLAILPKAPFELICPAKTAELIKYGCNGFLYTKVILANLLFDLASELGCDYQLIKQAMAADPRIGISHLEPVHKSGRGAGGHCFIKDFAALISLYKNLVNDNDGLQILEAMEKKNINLLKQSKKDFDLLNQVYGLNL